MNNEKEIQLVNECLKGTQSAFKALYENYKGYVYTICVRYGIKTIEVKDCMQTIFMELFKSLKKYDAEKAKFKTWFTKIIINQILAHKRKSNINYFSLDDAKINLVDTCSNMPLESLLDEKIIHEILNKMPAKYSTAFNLFIVDGYSHIEISEMLDISAGASRILVHRGRAWAMNELKTTFKDSINQIAKRK